MITLTRKETKKSFLTILGRTLDGLPRNGRETTMMKKGCGLINDKLQRINFESYRQGVRR